MCCAGLCLLWCHIEKPPCAAVRGDTWARRWTPHRSSPLHGRHFNMDVLAVRMREADRNAYSSPPTRSEDHRMPFGGQSAEPVAAVYNYQHKPARGGGDEYKYDSWNPPTATAPSHERTRNVCVDWGVQSSNKPAVGMFHAPPKKSRQKGKGTVVPAHDDPSSPHTQSRVGCLSVKRSVDKRVTCGIFWFASRHQGVVVK